LSFRASASNSDRAHADASKLRMDAALSINSFSPSVKRNLKYVDFRAFGSFFGLAMNKL
jgi:hypothetical protein